MTNFTIKSWAKSDRPREKMAEKGARALSDAELLAILISSGNKNETAVELSKRLLASVKNDLNELGKKDAAFLKSFNGIGEAKAITILAAMELGRRRKSWQTTKKVQIKSSQDAADYFMPLLGDLNHEEFWILLLDRSNKVIDKFCVSSGGITGTVVDVRMIMKKALDNAAVAIILCHNHPSSNMVASQEDKKITLKIVKAANLMDIKVLDHVIIGQNCYLSFADEGLIPITT